MFVFVIGTSRALTEGLDETPQHMQASMTTLFFMKPDIRDVLKYELDLIKLIIHPYMNYTTEETHTAV